MFITLEMSREYNPYVLAEKKNEKEGEKDCSSNSTKTFIFTKTIEIT